MRTIAVISRKNSNVKRGDVVDQLWHHVQLCVRKEGYEGSTWQNLATYSVFVIYIYMTIIEVPLCYLRGCP